jgi:hypothetical protein
MLLQADIFRLLSLKSANAGGLQQALADGQTVISEGMVVTARGGRVPAEVFVQPINWAGADLFAIFGDVLKCRSRSAGLLNLCDSIWRSH